MTRTPNDEQILEAMTRYGGGFAAALAEACYRADAGNFVRIKVAFPELFEEYAAIVRLRAMNQALPFEPGG